MWTFGQVCQSGKGVSMLQRCIRVVRSVILFLPRTIHWDFYSGKEMACIQIYICLICQVSGVARCVGRLRRGRCIRSCQLYTREWQVDGVFSYIYSLTKTCVHIKPKRVYIYL